MSLTNPNTPVSQQDLQDFYHKLLPYMGGSFGMIANKFSKGDMYSTDEKMIGQWIDGKPLYSKTVNFGVLPNKSTKEVEHNISDLDVIVAVKGIAFLNDNSHFYPLPYVSPDSLGDNILLIANKTIIRIMTGYNRSNLTNCYIVIQYTKTTDSAISIGDDTDYSTEEKIVGTWIDGKPLYQKTFIADTYWQVSGITEIAEMNDSSLNIEHIVNFVALTQSISGATWQDGTVMMQVSRINNVYKVIPKENGRFNIFTIQYTKTTD